LLGEAGEGDVAVPAMWERPSRWLAPVIHGVAS
jgi:hypothetical protein